MPRLLVASGIFHPESGGPATYLYQLLPELQKLGWDVQAISYGTGDTAAYPYPYPLVRIPREQPLPQRMLAYARAARPLAQWADLIYMHTPALPVWGGPAPRVMKIVGDQAWERAVRRGWIPDTTDIDDFQTGSYSPVVRLQKALRAREVRRMNAVIVPSQYLGRMVAGWGVPEARIHVIYNALPPHTPTLSITQGQARQQLGIASNTQMLLTVARLNPWKGIDHLISALAGLPTLQLYVAGNGPARPALEQQAHALHVTDRVHFIGQIPREQVALHMRAADYVALYSGYEGLSHTLLESLRAGTPVIASDKGGNPEVVTHGVNGLLIPYVDVAALAATLEAAFRPGQRQALAENVQLGLERFNFAHMVSTTAQTLISYL